MTDPNDPIFGTTEYRRATSDPHSDLAPFQVGGLTKREYFAAMALGGLLGNPNIDKQKDGTPHTYQTIAVTALQSADALIIELNKEVKP